MARHLRRTILTAAIALLPAALAVGTASTATAATATAATPHAGGAFPAHYAAPYLQIASGDAGDMAADMKASGNKFYTLAFLTPKSGCTPEWEDNGDSLGAFKSQISSLQSAGGNVIVSFGGAAGGELAQTCTSVSSLEAEYAKVVSTYGVTRLDFDIEGSVLDDTSANSRRDQALAQLQQADPSVQIDFTVPVDPTGLESDALALLKDAKSKGVKVNLVNIMTMDFGDGQNPLKDAESAATATEQQLGKIYTSDSSAQLWELIGLTPIAGQNDDNEDFTKSDASTWRASRPARACRSCPSGKSTATTRPPATPTQRPSPRSDRGQLRNQTRPQATPRSDLTADHRAIGPDRDQSCDQACRGQPRDRTLTAIDDPAIRPGRGQPRNQTRPRMTATPDLTATNPRPDLAANDPRSNLTANDRDTGR